MRGSARRATLKIIVIKALWPSTVQLRRATHTSIRRRSVPRLELNRIKTVFGRDRYIVENGERILAWDKNIGNYIGFDPDYVQIKNSVLVL